MAPPPQGMFPMPYTARTHLHGGQESAQAVVLVGNHCRGGRGGGDAVSSCSGPARDDGSGGAGSAMSGSQGGLPPIAPHGAPPLDSPASATDLGAACAAREGGGREHV